MTTPAPAHADTLNEEELRDITRRILENPEALDTLDDDTLIELKKRTNPIGTFIPSAQSFMVASVLNMKEEYMRKLTMTAMIGFIYRRAQEYVPDFVSRFQESYALRISKITADSAPGANDMQKMRDTLRAECDTRAKDHTESRRKVIHEFLDSIFSFDPDKHVRKATADLPVNAMSLMGCAPTSESESAQSAHPIFVESAECLRAEIEKWKAPPTTAIATAELATMTYEAAELVYKNARIAAANAAQTFSIITSEMARPEITPGARNSLEDTRQLIMSCRARLDQSAEIVGPYVAGRMALEATNVMQVVPPADVFYHFGRYFDSHYEVLRLMTDAIYQTPSDIENILIYYDTFDDREKAVEYIRVHESEFRAEPRIIENGGVTLLGPFRENRARVDLYNRNTEVLRLMMEQVARDQQLGKDLTKKRVVAAKRRNVRESGPDDAAGIEKYVAARGIVSQFGQRPSLTREERTRLAEAQQTCAERETPEGALAVRVLAPQLDEEGMPTDIQQSFFYTAAANVPEGTSDAGSSSAPSAH
jgi:hypothetical protein